MYQTCTRFRALLLLVLPLSLLESPSAAACSGNPLTAHRSPLNLCPRPELLQAQQVTDSSAQLTWTDVGDAYEVELLPADQPFTGTPTHFVNGDPPLLLTGLTPGRAYRFAVRTVCDDTTSSLWSLPRNFRTNLNNARPCPLSLDLRDTSCNSGPQTFPVHVDDAPGTMLGQDVVLHGIRIMIEHPWRSDLQVWLRSPDSTRVQIIGGLNAGDKNLGDPEGSPCAQYVELTEAGGALPLAAAAEQDNITGYYLPAASLAAFANGQNPNGRWRLEICDNKAGDVGKLRLFGLVFGPPDCPPVAAVAVQNVGATAAQVTWQASPGSDSVLIEYGPAGFYPGSTGTAGGGTAVKRTVNAAQPLILNGLQTRQWYEVYVRQLCAPGVWGPNAEPVRFFTNCPASLQETADTAAICLNGCADPCPLPGLWQNVPDDEYEWKVRTGAGLTWPTSGPGAASGGSGNYLFFRNGCSTGSSVGKKAILRTTCIQVSAPANAACHFSFDLYMNTKLGQMSSLALQASTDGGQTWATLQSWSGNRGKRWRREYVSLATLHDSVAQFQLVATGTFGSYGDLAIDNLNFYGSTAAGLPSHEFFRDADADGFGNALQRVVSCNPAVPAGYVTTAGDCDDANEDIYPGATEILCNLTDENCNGPADDTYVAPPVVPPVAVCSGQPAVLTASGSASGQFFWFDKPKAGLLLGIGSTLVLNNLTQTTTVYLLDSLPGTACASARVGATVTVHPRPELVQTAAPAICLGQTFDLATLPEEDLANAGGLLTYHSAFPPTVANQLTSAVVQPGATTTYILRSMTAFGCQDTAAATVTVRPLPAVQILQGDSINVCRGRPVSLVASASGGGQGAFTYAWSNGLNFAIIPVNASLTPNLTISYSVTATNSFGCTATDLIKVHSYNNITQAAILAVQNPSVCGGSDGSIQLDPIDGQPPYQFQWSGPVSGLLSNVLSVGTITGLKPGGYRITITDASGGICPIVLPQIVLSAPALQVAVDTILHPACPGQNTGSISLTVAGINPTYQWNIPQTTPTVSGLAPGTYSVTITDGSCSQVISNLEVTAPPAVEINLNKLVQVDCAGDSTGEIDLAVFGATPPFTYVWSNGSIGPDLTGVPAGAYQVTLTDAAGCTYVSPSWTVQQPQPIVINTTSQANVRCFGETNGAVAVHVTGGVPEYLYNWSNGKHSPQITGLAAGLYTLTVTDLNGCQGIKTVNVTQPAPLALPVADLQDPTCAGAADGRIELTPQGGQTPYHFTWSTGLPADTLPVLENRDAGVYFVTLTDAAGCTLAPDSFRLEAPQLLSLVLDTLVHIRCFDDPSGSIAVEVEGAEGQITVTWNQQPGSLDLSGLPAGDYAVQITDERLCTVRDTFTILQPGAALQLGLLEAENVRCAGEPGGNVEVLTTGGTPPYQYAWNTGQTTEDLAAVPVGVYVLTATDANGCSTELPSVVLTEPLPLVVTPAVVDIPCTGPVTGDIGLAVSGGMGPYQYLWSNGGTTQHIYDLAAGLYEVTVLDALGCAYLLDSLEVRDLEAFLAVDTLEVLPVSCSGQNDGRIAVQLNNGAPPFQFIWSAPVGLHPDVPVPFDVADNLSGGVYQVTVSDANDCVVVSEPFLIEEAPPLLIGLLSVTGVLCYGDTTGGVDLSFSGGLPPYTYSWSNGADTNDPGPLPAGTFFLTVTDQRSCSAVSPAVIVQQPAQAPAIVLDDLQPDACGNGEGAILLHLTGGTPPNTYFWSNGDTTASIGGLVAGTYQLTVTDQVGCTLISPPYLVPALVDPLQVASSNVVPVICPDATTGSISLKIEGGTPGYNYFWSHGPLTPNASGLPAGAYTLTVTDAAGCTDAFSFTVTGPPAWNIASTSTFSGSDWSVQLTVSGATPGYDIVWDAATGNQTGPVASGLAAGTYGYTVTDSEGCTVSGLVTAGTIGTGEPGAGLYCRVEPNPTTGSAWAVLRLPAARGVQVWLLDGLGRELTTVHAGPTFGEIRLPLDLSARPAGLYWLRIRVDSGESRTLPIVRGER